MPFVHLAAGARVNSECANADILKAFSHFLYVDTLFVPT